ncbi:MAG: CDP-alcohol phosphatidyltransferase family protein [Thermoleophilaceae bacterium]
MWTREQLRLLLDARFSPPAIAHFLVSSQRRAGDVRRRRPELGRQSRALIGAGALAWAAPAAAGMEPFRGHAREGLGWWALCALMLDWHLGMVETADGRPRPLGAADALTLARAWLAPVALERPTPAVLTAGFTTDVLDGIAARRLAEPTRAGRDLEGLADLCFAGATLVGLRRRGAIGRAASTAELGRLATGLAYALLVYFGRARAPEAAFTRAARATTPVRAAGLIAAATGHGRLGTWLVGLGCAASVALTIERLAGKRANVPQWGR